MSYKRHTSVPEDTPMMQNNHKEMEKERDINPVHRGMTWLHGVSLSLSVRTEGLLHVSAHCDQEALICVTVPV